MICVIKFIATCLLVLGRADRSSAALGRYGADTTKVSVSGVSSGANMAVQLHVAYSSTIMGVGAVAGAPYYCAEGVATKASIGDCSAGRWGNPNNVDIQHLKSVTDNWAISEKVDATSNMASDKVYLFSGTSDTVVPTALVQKLEAYYDEYIDPSNKKTVYNLPAGHAFITTNYGNSCGSNLKPNINDCDYNMAFEILNHIYGNLEEPDASTTLAGKLLFFNQKEFFPSTSYSYMASTGFIYVPSGCALPNSGCKLHIALHGCLQTTLNIFGKYYTHTGYNEVAELNNIIILYPQILRTLFVNPFGCWDWWGYTNGDYATKNGSEMKIIKKMIDRILS